MGFDFDQPCTSVASRKLRPKAGANAGESVDAVSIITGGTCHAVIMWLELDLCDGVPAVSCGPSGVGMHYHRQMVWFLEEEATCKGGEELRALMAEFEPEECALSVRFEVSRPP